MTNSNESPYKYKAFISYSHAADHKLASALQSALQSFARPYYLSKTMLVFRDKTELSANPALWPTIQNALAESEYFILLASPRAASSRWVQREIDFWLQIHNNTIDKMLIVWTDGELPWNTSTGMTDWNQATALPAELTWNHTSDVKTDLTVVFQEEPLYLDFRKIKEVPDLSLRDSQFLDQVATLSAALQNRRKSELIGEDASRLRRYRRIRTGIIALLSVLVLLATGAAIIARQQTIKAKQALANEQEAREQAQKALVSEKVAKKEAEDRRREAEDALEKVKVANKKTEKALAAETIAKNQAESRRVEAEHQTQIALSKQLTAQAQSMRSQRTDSLPLTMLLTVESMRRSTSLEDDQLLRSGLSLLPQPQIRIPVGANTRVTAIARHPRENWLATAITSDEERDTKSSSIQLWDLANGKFVRELAPTKREIQTLLFNSDGSQLLGLDSNYVLTIWDSKKNWDATQLEIRNRVPGGLSQNAVKISPDGRFVAARYSNHGLAVFPIDQAAAANRTHWHPDSVITWTFSVDGNKLATASADGVWLWDLTSASEPVRIKQPSQVRSLAFSKDSKFLAVGCQDRTVIWKLQNQLTMHEIDRGQLVYALTFSHDGRFLATASMRGGIQVWDLNNEGTLHSRMTQKEDVLDLVFNPNDRELYSIDQNRVVRAWDIYRNDREIARVAHVQSVNAFTFSASGESLITAGDDAHVTVWQSSSQQEAARITRNTLVRSLAFSPDTRYLASSGVDNKLRLWNMSTGREESQVTLGYSATDLAFSRDGGVVATFIRPFIHIFSVPELKPVRNITIEAGIRQMVLTSDGQYVSACSDRFVLVWEVATGRLIHRLAHSQEINAIALDTNDTYLAAGDQEGNIRIWNIVSGKESANFKTTAAVTSLKFSVSNRYVAAISNNHTARVFDLKRSKELANTNLGSQGSDICFSPDEQKFAVAVKDGTARVYKTNGGVEVVRLSHIRPVMSINFSPDGSLLATRIAGRDRSQEVGLLDLIWWGKQTDSLVAPASLSDEDNALRVWNTKTWKEVARLAHDSEVTRFAFSADSRYVATGSEQGARVFYLWPEDLIEVSKKRLVENLSKDQWREYLSPNPYKRTFKDLPIPEDR